MSRPPVFRFAAGLSCAAFAILACGTRGPLDDSGIVTVAADAGGDVAQEATATEDASADAPVEAAREAGIIDCGVCLFSQCNQPIFACIQSTGCRTDFQCVIQTCGTAGLNPTCLLKCAAGDPAGALQILQIFQCVTGKCGPDCGGLLAGLPGLPGGGGAGGGGRGGAGGGAGGGGGGGAGAGAAADPPVALPIAEAFLSRWPELSTKVDTRARE